MILTRFSEHTSFFSDLKLIPWLAGGAAALVVSSLVINILSLALPVTLMQVYDRIVPNQSIGTLAWLTTGFFVVLIIETSLRFCRSTYSNWASARFEHLVAVEAMERTLSCRIEEFERWGVGEHMDKLNAVNTLKSFYSGQALQVLMDLPFAVIFLVVLGYIGGAVMVLFPILLLVCFAVLCVFCRASYYQSRHAQLAAGDKRYNFIIEALGGIHTIKALTLEEQMLRRYERLQEATAKANLSASVLSVLTPNLGLMFSQILLFGLVLIGGLKVIDGSLTMGGMAACSLLGGRLFQPFQSALSFWVHYSDLVLAKKQLQGVACMRGEVSEDALPIPRDVNGEITLEGIDFQFTDNSPHLLQNVSLALPAKEFVAVKSSDGRASTALLYLMMGLYSPQQGRVLLDGLDLSKHNHQNFKGLIEYLPHMGTLFNASIFENISMGAKFLHENAKDAATLTGLDDLVAQLPQGYETMVGNRLHEFLPTGMVQRICLARALVVRPRVLLFDRFDTSLDSESERLLLWLLGKLRGACSIVFVTNHPTILDMADKVYELESGKIRELYINTACNLHQPPTQSLGETS